MSLPSWLTRPKPDGAFVVDADQAYPIALAALGLPVDQYSLEVAYQCIKLKVQEIVAGLPDDPRAKGKALVISIESKDKAKWKQANHPKGRGPAPATKGREARQHYERLRYRLAAAG